MKIIKKSKNKNKKIKYLSFYLLIISQLIYNYTGIKKVLLNERISY